MSTICYLLQMGKDLLAVLSDSGKLSFLSFSNEMHRFLLVYSYLSCKHHVIVLISLLFGVGSRPYNMFNFLVQVTQGFNLEECSV